MPVAAVVAAAVVGAGATMYSAKKSASATENAIASQEKIAKKQLSETERIANMQDATNREAMKLVDERQKEATALVRTQFNEVTASLAPYAAVGPEALKRIETRMGVDYAAEFKPEERPGYELAVEKGIPRLEKSFAGETQSGRYSKALLGELNAIGENLYGNYLNEKLYYPNAIDLNLVNVGESAAARTGTAGMKMAGDVNAANNPNALVNIMTDPTSSNTRMAGINAASALQSRASGYQYEGAINNANLWTNYASQMGNLGSTYMIANALKTPSPAATPAAS